MYARTLFVRGLMIIALIATGSSCGSEATFADCSPGATQTCICGSNSTGVQECSAEGTWPQCACDGLDAGGDEDADSTLTDTATSDDTSVSEDTNASEEDTRVSEDTGSADTGVPEDTANDPDPQTPTGTCADNLGSDGVCTNSADCDQLESWAGQLLDISNSCAEECTAEPVCVSACAEEDIGVSGACGDCFADLVTCAVIYCSALCSDGECVLCLESNGCADEFAECAGFDLLAEDVIEGDPDPDLGSDATDMGLDTGTADTGTADTGTADTGTADTGTADTGTADTGTADTGTVDTGLTDTDTGDTVTGPLNRWDEAIWDENLWGP